jgi:hypothetical protein
MDEHLDEKVSEDGSKTTLGLNNNNGTATSTEVPTPSTEIVDPSLSPVQEHDAQLPEEETPSPVVPAEVDVVPAPNIPSPLTGEKFQSRKRKRSASKSSSSSSSVLLTAKTDMTKKFKKLETLVKTLTRKVTIIENNIPRCFMTTRKKRVSKKPRTLP